MATAFAPAIAKSLSIIYSLLFFTLLYSTLSIVSPEIPGNAAFSAYPRGYAFKTVFPLRLYCFSWYFGTTACVVSHDPFKMCIRDSVKVDCLLAQHLADFLEGRFFFSAEEKCAVTVACDEMCIRDRSCTGHFQHELPLFVVFGKQLFSFCPGASADVIGKFLEVIALSLIHI